MKTILNIVEKTLKKDSRLWSEDEKPVLLKAKLIELLTKDDEELLSLLIQNKEIEKRFFKKVEKATIFQKDRFIQLVTMNEFLPSSFTAFENKIGLAKNGKLLSQNNDIALVFPHKDCILEGGQTKEEQKRDEIFYNTILAPDEVDRLKEPKVFTNAKRFSANEKGEITEEEITEISETDNMIIKGNNLMALYSLLPRYKGKIKLIYIDPPYYFHTKKKEDTFAYNSNFKLSSWLTFMKNRLELSRELLSEDGAIFVQISDDGVAELHQLLKEVFNKNSNNFINKITIKTKSPSGFASVNAGVFETAEYILSFAKNKKHWIYNPQYIESSYDKNYKWFITNKNECYSKWNIVDLFEYIAKKQGFKNKKEAIKKLGKLIFEQIVSDFALKNKEKIFQSTAIGDNAGKHVLEIKEKSKNQKNVVFMVTRDKYYNVYILNGRELAFYSKKVREVNGKEVPSIQLSNIWTDTPYEGIANEGCVKLKGGKKPEKLLQRIISLGTQENDIVLDFFSGSGTTPAVAHKMNRKWIAIEQMDYIHDLPEARLKKVLEGEQGGISKSVNWKGGGSFVYTELLEWNQKYIDLLEKAKTDSDIEKIKKQIEKEQFYKYQINLDEFDEDEFSKLSLEDKKKVLLDVLDLNHLYVNIHSMDDETFKVSEKDKELNRNFYNLEK